MPSLLCSWESLLRSPYREIPNYQTEYIPVFRGLHHECLEAILRKSRDYPVFIVVFCTLNLFYFFYLFDIIMV